MKFREPNDPTRKFSEGGGREHQLALGICCPYCGAAKNVWCPMPGTSWNLCGERINLARGYNENGIPV
jgi:hypothetical protein